MNKTAFAVCVAAVATGAALAADVTVAGLNAPNGTLAVDSGTSLSCAPKARW